MFHQELNDMHFTHIQRLTEMRNHKIENDKGWIGPFSTTLSQGELRLPET